MYGKRRSSSLLNGRNVGGRFQDSGNGLMARIWRSLSWMFSSEGKASDSLNGPRQFENRFVPLSLVPDKHRGYKIKASSDLGNLPPDEESHKKSNPYNSLVFAQPTDILNLFTEKAPIRVREAVRKILSQLTGSIGKFCIETMLITTPDRLASLLNNLQMTGYLLWNAEYRYSLCEELNPGSYSSDFPNEDEEKDLGPRTDLQDTLFQFVKTLPDEIVYGLVENVSVPVVDAMRRSVDSAIDALTNGAANQIAAATTATTHLHSRVLVQQTGSSTLHLCFWHLALGYWFRDLEVKLELASAINTN
ncbi:Protein of unknown function DUF760 [Babesia duncani]|uniref:Uncharacterized protein n=1 Tax=Babesia duncani TaxID=323732 RepID=A0AAD9UPP9_9APIC|nr:Protein of unknown function DUF760 [Babesia duncani]